MHLYLKVSQSDCGHEGISPEKGMSEALATTRCIRTGGLSAVVDINKLVPVEEIIGDQLIQ